MPSTYFYQNLRASSLVSVFIFQIHVLLFWFGFWSCPWHMEVPGPWIKPMLLQRPEPPQWQHWILNPLCHRRTLKYISFRTIHTPWLKDNLSFDFIASSTLLIRGEKALISQPIYIVFKLSKKNKALYN